MRQIIFLNEISVDAKLKIAELQRQLEMIDNSDLLTASQKKSRKLPLLKQIRALKSGSKVD